MSQSTKQVVHAEIVMCDHFNQSCSNKGKIALAVRLLYEASTRWLCFLCRLFVHLVKIFTIFFCLGSYQHNMMFRLSKMVLLP